MPSDTDLLAALPLFAGCSRSQLRQLLNAAEVQVFDDGTVLAAEGELGSDLFVIAAGEAIVSAAGKEVDRLTRGEFFGELSLLDEEPRSATVTGSQPGRVYRFSKRALDKVLDANPKVVRAMVQVLAQRVRQAEGAVTYAGRGAR